MPRFSLALLAVAALAAAAPAASQARGLPRAHPVDVSKAHGPARLAHPGVKRHVPKELRAWSRSVGRLHGADHWTGQDVLETQFEDQHGHKLTFATDNKSVDVTPWANLLASTYHGDEIERVHVFVTSSANLTAICGEDAAACYTADGDERPGTGLMIVSYEDDAQLATHAVIHEYGHHIDNNTYNLGTMSDCRIDGDGSRRWFFTRQVEDNILAKLTCDPNRGWGQLLPEVYAEDYAQLVGIPADEYHPAIEVPAPSNAVKRALKADLDKGFGPTVAKAKGRSSASKVKRYTLRLGVPVFVSLASKSSSVRGVAFSKSCRFPGVSDAFFGKCKVTVKTRRARQKFSFKLLLN